MKRKYVISCNLRAIRKERGLSQEKLAEMSGVSLRAIQRIENKKVSPTVRTLGLIEDALEVEPNHLQDKKNLEPFAYRYLKLYEEGELQDDDLNRIRFD